MFLGCLSFKVYLRRRPPLRCSKCQLYAHIAAACQGTRRCRKCGGDHELSECRESAFKCGSCGAGQMAGSRKCEQYKQAVKVQQYRKVNKGASYAKAVKQVVKCGEVEEMRRNVPLS